MLGKKLSGNTLNASNLLSSLGEYAMTVFFEDWSKRSMLATISTLLLLLCYNVVWFFFYLIFLPTNASLAGKLLSIVSFILIYLFFSCSFTFILGLSVLGPRLLDYSAFPKSSAFLSVEATSYIEKSVLFPIDLLLIIKFV